MKAPLEVRSAMSARGSLRRVIMGVMDDYAILHVRNPGPLHLATYVALLIMAGIGLGFMPDPPLSTVPVLAAAFCTAFGVLYTFGFRAARTRRSMSLYFVLQVSIVTVLVSLHPDPTGAFAFLLFVL